MKNVLISFQSTIPHYRVPFYNALERLRPDTWCFQVVYDSTEIKSKRFFREPLNFDQFDFNLLDTKTLSLQFSNKRISVQSFVFYAGKFDLLILGSSFNNLSYPFSLIHQISGTKIALWGHGQDRGTPNPGGVNLLKERIRLWMIHMSDGYFAYTPGVKKYLERQGIDPTKIFVTNNTIDINAQRAIFNKLTPDKEKIRRELGVSAKNKVLLFVGRLTKRKRIDYILKAFSILQKIDNTYHLFIVGDKVDSSLDFSDKNITYFGSIVDLDKLGPIYMSSDIFICPGGVGLGPLQALCYNLPIITIDSEIHGPEFEYLSPRNSIILNSGATPEEYSQTIMNLFDNRQQLNYLQDNAWPSIEYLTIEQMANNFIRGINNILEI